MDAFTLSGGLVNTMTNGASAIGTGNLAMIGALFGFIVIVVGISFARGLISKGLARIGF